MLILNMCRNKLIPVSKKQESFTTAETVVTGNPPVLYLNWRERGTQPHMSFSGAPLVKTGSQTGEVYGSDSSSSPSSSVLISNTKDLPNDYMALVAFYDTCGTYEGDRISTGMRQGIGDFQRNPDKHTVDEEALRLKSLLQYSGEWQKGIP